MSLIFAWLFIYIVGDDHICLQLSAAQLFQQAHERIQGLCIHPVITVQHFEIRSPGILEAAHDGPAMAAIALMQGTDGIRIAPGIIIRDQRRIVG